MTYATQQNMIDRYGQQELVELTDRANLGVLDGAILDSVLADADSEINAYLASRYTLPLASVPPVLMKFACDIARYQLYDTRASEQVRDRYKAAIAFLKMVSEGKASLGLDATLATPVADTGGIGVSAAPRVFGRDSNGDDTLSDY